MEMAEVRKYSSAKLALFIVLFFAVGHTASAGTLRKPPNNLGLVAYWPFNEGNGSIAGDASGNGHTGTLLGTSLPTWANGKLGGSLSFSGGSSDARVTFSSITTGTTNTVSVWVYLATDCNAYSNIFAQDGVDGLYCYKNGGGSNKIDFYKLSGTTDNYNNTSLALNRWYHVAIVNSAGSATFYLNGVADGTVSSAPSFSVNNIGGDSLDEVFPGKIDEVRLYNRALSASDVYALYKSGAVQVKNSNKSPGTLSTGLTGYWTFDGKDMIENVADVSGNGRHGRLVSFTSTTTAPGKVGQALNFSGVTSGPFVNTATTVTNFMSSATGSVSVWLRPTDGTTNFTAASSVYNAQPAISSSGIFGSFGISRGYRVDTGQDMIWVWKYSDALIGIPYVVGEWAHITLVHANGTLYAYKNGDLAGSAAAGNFGNFNGLLYIGGVWSGSTARWKGDLDEVRTYNRELSATEVKQLYNLTSGTKVNKTATNSLANGLVGYWTFDGKDMYSNVADISGGGNHGILSGFTSTTTTIGKIGQALNFSGSNSVDIPMTASLSPLTHDYAVSLWYKGLSGSFMGGPDAFDSYIQIGSFAGGGDVTFYDSGGGASANKTFTLSNENDWHHLVAVLDRSPSPDTVTVYIDGVSQGSGTDTLDGESIGFSGTLHLGKGSWANASFHSGPLDEVRIYNRTLSSAEVLKLYRMGK